VSPDAILDLWRQALTVCVAVAAPFLIAGLVVGLFNNFTQGISLSPLAVAFLVGYGVEIFFSFLDTFLATLRKVRSRQLPQRA